MGHHEAAIVGRVSDFFSPRISNAQRLPNGNTLINEGWFGRFFEVTGAGEVVPRRVSPPPADAGPSLRASARLGASSKPNLLLDYHGINALPTFPTWGAVRFSTSLHGATIVVAANRRTRRESPNSCEALHITYVYPVLS